MLARTISHFEIGDSIGEGGIGVVHRGRDINLDRPVAIKFLHSRLLNSKEAVRKFRREARVLSNLNHPNIATVYEVGEEDEQQFIVLEYLPGGSLSTRIRDLRATGLQLSMRQVVDVSLQIAEGLSYAHRQGLVHRDIKPGNILCTLDGKLKITDFGLAKFMKSGDSTVAGRIEGTIPYMAPEQIRGQEANQRSDIYSFGVTVFELATGERAYGGPNEAAVMHSILSDPVPSLRRGRPDADQEFADLVEKMMAKDAGDRPERIEAVVAELALIKESYPPSHEIVTFGSGSADSQTIPVTTIPLTRRRSVPWRGISLVALVLILSGAAAGASRLWSLRCLIARGWFGDCSVTAEKHIGVLKFSVPAPKSDEVLAAGMRAYLVSQLGRLAKFEPGLCVHAAEDRSRFGALNLSIESRLIHTGATMSVAAELVRVSDSLQLSQTTPVEFNTASFQDRMVTELAQMLGIQPEERARRAMGAGSTGIKEAFQSYIAGLGELAKDKPDLAISDFQKAISEDKFYASAHAGLAEAYRRKYERSKETNLINLALHSATTATEKDAELPEGHLTLGRVHYLLGHQKEAVEELRKAVDLMPVNFDGRYELVEAYVAMGATSDAQAVAEKGAELSPRCWVAQHDLASFYRSLGRFDDAEKHFRQVVDLMPKNSTAHSNLAATFYDQQKYKDAEHQWKEALKLQATSTVYTNLGQLYIRTGCFHAAERALDEATAVAPDDFLAYGNLGEAFHLLPEHKVREQGLFARALKLAQQERVTNPTDPQVVRMVAFYHARMGERRTALETIQQAIDLAPDNIHTLYRAAFLYELTGERDHAVALLQRVVKEDYQTRELCTHPDLQGLRNDSRFARMLDGKCSVYKSQVRESFSCPGSEQIGRLF